MIMNSQVVSTAVADGDSRGCLPSSTRNIEGPVRDFLVWVFFQTQIGKQHAFTLLLKVSVLRGDSWRGRGSKDRGGAGEQLHCSVRSGGSSPQVTA